jgi:vanillate O-demethylase ferredoxin subunit
MIEPMLTVRVARKTMEAVDICSVELVAASGLALPAFSAGSHIDVHLPNGVTRQYSLCNAPGETHRYVLGILRDPSSRGGSQAMHELVHEGDELRVSLPRNLFTLADGAAHSLLIAGGIGVTPILCMAEQLSGIGHRFEMHYCTRSRERTAFYGRIKQAAFGDQVNFHFDDGEAGQKLDLDRLLATPQPGTHLYVCGPNGFMEAVLNGARARGWNEQNLHSEFFAAAKTPSADDASFQVKLARSNRIIVVPKDKTVTMALSEAGIDIPTSCEQGMCGTCLTRVLEGEPDHKDMYLTAQEHAQNDQFLPCCSRSKSAMLVLDL